MKKFFAVTILALATVAVTTGPAAAAPIYVGSWEVDDGPDWQTVPQQYSGLEAAALLFGGLPTDYVISTVDNNAANINNMAWYSTWGGACGGAFPCGTLFNEAFQNGVLYDTPGDVSSYVRDWAVGPQYTNYAFRTVPEPASLILLGSGLAAAATRVRRRKK